MKKNNASGNRISKPLWILSLILRIVLIAVAAFCLYRLAQIVGDNPVPLGSDAVRFAAYDDKGTELYAIPDLREKGNFTETFSLQDGFQGEISAKKNSRKKFNQITFRILDKDGSAVFVSEEEPLQYIDTVNGDIRVTVTSVSGQTPTARVEAQQSEISYIQSRKGLYIAGLILGLLGFVLVGTLTKVFRQDTAIARTNSIIVTVLKYLLLAVVLVVALFPILWMAFASLLPSQHVMQIPPVLGITSESSFANYQKVFSQAKYLRYYLNSFITAGGSVLVVMFIALLASYSFSRYNFRGKNVILTVILSVQMFPIVAILISLYGFYMRWNLVDNYFGVILADTVQALPLAIMLLRSFFDTLPRSLDESARIDGAGRLRTMFNILVPLTVPGLVAVGIYTFLSAWDDYLMSLTIMKTDEMKTLPVGLAQSFLGEYAHDYGALMAFAMGGSLPIVLMFIFFQKYMISGMTAGAVKG